MATGPRAQPREGNGSDGAADGRGACGDRGGRDSGDHALPPGGRCDDVSIGDALDITTEDTIVVAQLKGEIDLANAKPIRSLVAGAVANDATGVVLDLTETTYPDSPGGPPASDLKRRPRAPRQRLA